MKTPPLLLVICLALLGSLRSAPAAPRIPPPDPTGTWQWSTKSPDGEIPTTLKLQWQGGKLTGAYSNQFGSTAISSPSLQGRVIQFDIVRDLGSQKYVVKYHGTMEGDTISGTIQAPGHDSGKALKLDWNAKRTTKETAGDPKPKS